VFSIHCDPHCCFSAARLPHKAHQQSAEGSARANTQGSTRPGINLRSSSGSIHPPIWWIGGLWIGHSVGSGSVIQPRSSRAKQKCEHRHVIVCLWYKVEICSGPPLSPSALARGWWAWCLLFVLIRFLTFCINWTRGRGGHEPALYFIGFFLWCGDLLIVGGLYSVTALRIKRQ